MINKMRLFFLNNRNTLRIVRYTLISVILLIMAWVFDIRYPGLKKHFPEILLLSPEVTSSFLSTLTGTFLTVSTFSFSTILIVLNKYADSFTPRIVQDFIDKPNVLSLFGIFIGGFFYTVFSLFLIQNIDNKLHLFSGTIGIFYAIAAMISFVFFVRRVVQDIKVSNVIENIYQRASKLIETEAGKRENAKRFKAESYVDKIKIYSNQSGYLYDIDYDTLLSQLEGIKCEFIIEKRIGDFVLKEMPIAHLNLLEACKIEGEEKKELLEKLLENLIINTGRNDTDDYHYQITNLVEISLKALSPGINDPNTSILAIRKIGILLGKLFATGNFYRVVNESKDSKIIYNGYSPEEELYLAYSQILHYGKADPEVAKAILNSIYLIYIVSDKSLQARVEDFFNHNYEICLNAMESHLDKEQLQIIHMSFHQKRMDSQITI